MFSSSAPHLLIPSACWRTRLLVLCLLGLVTEIGSKPAAPRNPDLSFVHGLAIDKEGIKASICTVSREATEPAFIVGRLFSLLLGDAFAYAEVPDDIPFLDETRARSYEQVPMLRLDDCLQISDLMLDSVAANKRSQRYCRLRECAHETFGARIQEQPQLEQVVFTMVSELALKVDFDLNVTCKLMEGEAIWSAINEAVANLSMSESGAASTGTGVRFPADVTTLFPYRNVDPQTPVDVNLWDPSGVNGLVSQDENSEVCKSGTCGAKRGARHDSACDHLSWWACESASEQVAEYHTEWSIDDLKRGSAAGFLAVFQSLHEYADRTVKEAYVWLLGRLPDQRGFDSYINKIEEGATYTDIRGYLQESHEYIERCEYVACRDKEEQVRAVFREILLRDPEYEALDSYSHLLTTPGGKEEMRRVLLFSEEYQSLCLQDHGPSCLEVQKVVRAAFKEVMGRPPDSNALAAYSREILFGHLTVDGMKDHLRHSKEYKYGVALRLQGNKHIEQLKSLHPDCPKEAVSNLWGSKTALYGAGRWCQRGTCEKDSATACTPWPLTTYQQVQALLWGNTTLESLGYDTPDHMRKLNAYTNAHSTLVESYSTILGRYPDTEKLAVQVREIVEGAVSESKLQDLLKESDEFREKTSVVQAKAASWALKLEILARLFVSNNISLPEEVKPCFGPGFVHVAMHELEEDTSFYCQTIEGHVLYDIEQMPPSSHPECLSGRASWSVCAEGQWLCRPLPGLKPPQAIKDMALSIGSDGLGGMVPQVIYFPNGRQNARARESKVCAYSGVVLRKMQEHWNQKAPLFNVNPGEEFKSYGEDSIPIAVYVYQRPQYFQEVLAKLRDVKNIDQAPVVVISMDDVDRDILKIAEALDFAPFRLIFHPARPDLFSQEPLLAIKSHWLWLQDMLWTQIPETRMHHGHIALLEEDHVVTPDYYEVMHLLVQRKKEHCPLCWGICVRYGCKDVHDSEPYKICRSHSVINTGIAFNRTTYDAIKRSDFASFSDGWDWSLFHLAQTGQMPDMMLAPAVSRIRNIGVHGATVTEEANDDFLLGQLDYSDVGRNANFDPESFYIDQSVPMVYVPPSWEPLFMGQVGFITELGHDQSLRSQNN